MSATDLTHLGFIVDGNRRWAKERGLPTLEGHRRGVKKVEEVIEALKNTEVKFITFFLFSTENWNRSPEEVKYLMALVRENLPRMAKKIQAENGRFVILGRPENVEPSLWQELMQLEANTEDNSGPTVGICFNYGGQWEIADAATKAIASGEKELTPETFAKYVYHPEIPPCDMIVRTSGEERISGFMLWRAAYAELLFLDKYFPGINKDDCEEIIKEFHSRQRRFGK